LRLYFGQTTKEVDPVKKIVLRSLALAALALTGSSFAQVSDDDSASPRATDAKINFDPLQDNFAYNRVIVYFAQGRSAGTTEVMASMASDVRKQTGADLSFVREIATGGYLFEFTPGAASVKGAVSEVDDSKTADVMRAIAARGDVSSVEPDAIMTAFATPNDTSYNSQWHYFEATGGLNLPLAWDKSTGTGVTVAVLDTGIASHSDLNANVVAGYDFISSSATARDGNGRDSNPADEGDWSAANECGSGSPASGSSWHGTHVAGTIAAVTNNSKGVAGVAYGAKVSPVRVLGKCGGSISDIADAIIWASGGTVSGAPANANVAKVINMSLGGGGSCGTTTQNAINGAVSRGTVVIVAAGNSNTNASGFNPANCSNVVTVAATNRAGGRAFYSNFGANVDVAAPGGELSASGSSNGVLSTLNASTTSPGAESYAYYQGTSMATPHVAGVAALILSKGAQTPANLETLLKNNTRAFPATCSSCGTGIVDANKVLSALTGGGGGGGTGASFFENQNDVAITDLATVSSSITVSGRTGNASSALQVGVTILHTYRGDLQIDLIAPNGTAYRLKNTSTSDSADNVIGTYTVDASAVAANGTWRLQVRDAYSGDTGRIDKWSLQF
jgi:serine protease